MYAYELNADHHTVHSNDRRRPASPSASASDGHSHTTTESVQKANSELGINSRNDNNSAPRLTTSPQLAMRSTALGSHGSRWLGGLSADTRSEFRDFGDHPDLRRRPLYKLRSADRRWQRRPEDDIEAWDELTMFLRNVTPPPSNYMSAPTDPYSPTLPSRSIKRRGSSDSRGNRKKKGPLKRCLQFLKGRSKQKKSARKPPSVRALSPPVVRTVSRKSKRPPQIKLPDTAVSGRTIDGYRHIAISIPVEHAHLSPESKDGFRKASRRTKSLPSVDIIPTARNSANVRPMSAFANESHAGTQLGSVAEERGSLSSRSRSWARGSQRSREDAHDSGIASRHTFGPVEEQTTIPDDTGSMTPPRVPRRTSDRYDAPSLGRPSTSQTNDDSRDIAHRRTLAALSRPQPTPRPLNVTRPASAVSVQSAYSFRSFATPSPSPRVYYPMRKTSLHFAPPRQEKPQARSVSDQRGRNPRSRDSSRDKYTMQESIFSERSFLESTGTLASDSDSESGVITEGMQAMGYPLPAGDVHNATQSAAGFERHDGDARDSGENRDRESKRTSVQGSRSNSGQETRRSSWQEAEEAQSWQRNAPVVFNSEVRTVEAHVARQSQMRDSVEIVLETPTEASWPDGINDSSGEEDEKGFRNAGDDPGRKIEFKGKATEETPENMPGEDTQPSTSLPSLKKRGGRRKELLLSREQKIAELRQKLETPGMEPKDLVWRRESSSSSDGSSDECQSIDEGTTADKTTTKHLSAILESSTDTLEVTPGRFSLSAVMTVADFKPSSLRTTSPEPDLTSPLSTSSTATMATVVKARSMPHHSIGSVTPPDSPPDSPTSSSPVSSIEAQPRGTPLQHPSSRLLNSSRRQLSASGIQPYVSSGMGSPTNEDFPSWARRASNGLLPSNLHSERHLQAREHVEDNHRFMETPRGEPSDLGEAQDEKKVHDMEKRLTKLEKYRDHWMTSMIPLLTDMGQALGNLATNNRKGKGKEVDRSPQTKRQSRRPNTSTPDGRMTRLWRRGSVSEDAEISTRAPTRDDDDDPLDSDEVVMQHHPDHIRTSRSRADTNTSERSRWLYPLDEAPRRPGLEYDDFTDDECRARSSSRCESSISSRRQRHRGRTTSVPPRAAEAARPPRARTSSGMRSVVDYDRAGRMSSPAPPDLALPMHLHEGVGRFERLERHNRRVEAGMRSVSLGGRSARRVGPDGYPAGAVAAAGGANGLETLEGLMNELEILGNRLGMGSVDGGDGDAVREAPRAVVGFGAFR